MSARAAGVTFGNDARAKRAGGFRSNGVVREGGKDSARHKHRNRSEMCRKSRLYHSHPPTATLVFTVALTNILLLPSILTDTLDVKVVVVSCLEVVCGGSV